MQLPPIPSDRPATRRAVAALKGHFTDAFARLAPLVVDDVQHHAALADYDPEAPPTNIKAIATKIAGDADLTTLTAAGVAAAPILVDVAHDTAALAIGQVIAAHPTRRITAAASIDPQHLGEAADRIAVDVAKDRAGEMVGKKWDSNGDLVDNPDAKWSITDATRDSIRDVIAGGFANKETVGEISADIVNSTALSQDRAELIARTEVAHINNSVALASYRVARDKGGVPMKKQWVCLGDNACDVCLGNQDDGDIDLDDLFSSGDDSPPLHPRCFCEVAAVTGDDDDDDE